MFFKVRLWKGLTAPYDSSYQLKRAEQINGLWTRTAFLLLIVLIVSGISAYFGIGNEQLSKLIYDSSSTKFESIKGLYGVGQVLQSVLVTALSVFLPALIFWIFTDVGYLKLVVVQLFVTFIFILEKIITLPFQLAFGIDNASSPFSLGIIAQYITKYELLANFLGAITLFSIWAMVLQFKYLRGITEKSTRVILVLILSINLFLWIFEALFSFIKFEVLF